MTANHLRFEKDTRYYVLRLERALLGDWCVMRIWGSRSTRAGSELIEYYGSYDEAQQRLDQLAAVRERQRGYRRVEEGNEA
jgi:predicted DNA-binding WGR domain protein